MTFHARLTELLEKAKTSRLSFNDLQDLLTDHAEAIRDLVVAAELQNRQWNSPLVSEALAKLEEA